MVSPAQVNTDQTQSGQANIPLTPPQKSREASKKRPCPGAPIRPSAIRSRLEGLESVEDTQRQRPRLDLNPRPADSLAAIRSFLLARLSK